MSDFFNGSEQILSILIDGVKTPIACLTENSFSESSDFIETTTRDNKGWKTGRPLNQGYSISFSGIQVVSNIPTPTQASYDILKIFKRQRLLIDWIIETSTDVFVEGGQGYITALSESSAAEGLLTFSGEILGYGALEIPALKAPSNFIFQGGENYIFQ